MKRRVCILRDIMQNVMEIDRKIFDREVERERDEGE